MSDEISRLRKMRQTALESRLLARLLNDTARRDSAAGRAAVLSWRIARSATARLRAHPHRPYHSDPGLLEAVVGSLRAVSVGIPALYRKRPINALQRELLRLARVIDDVRALTLSPDLSDTLGRGQVAMRQLLDEVNLKVRSERGWRQELHADAPVDMTPTSAQGASSYLAL
jgi:hypothetical protein